MDTQIEGPKLLKMCDFTILPRTLAVVNSEVNLKTVQEGHLNDVQCSQAYINDHLNTILIPKAYMIENAFAATIPHMILNLATEEVNLTKGDMLS